MIDNQSLKPGMNAPDFSLPSYNNNIIELSSLRGKIIILYFYPKDDTPDCTTQAKNFSQINDELTKLNAIIVGISKDSVESHENFQQKYCLNFPLLADISNSVCQEYQVWKEKSMYGKKYMGIERTTFLIDTQGVIKQIWHKVSVTNHAEEILAAVKELAQQLIG